MDLLGTIVNVLAILVGGGFGCLLYGKIPVWFQRLILQGMGIVALFLGTLSLLNNCFVHSETALEVEGTMLVVISLLIGGVIGMALRPDLLLNKLVTARTPSESAPKGKPTDSRKQAIRHAKQAGRAAGQASSGTSKTSPKNAKGNQAPASGHFLDASDLFTPNHGAEGLMLSTVLFALSGMGLSGAMTAGMGGGSKQLLIKASIDITLAFALAALYGTSTLAGAAPVLVIQGSLTVAASTWADFFTDKMVSHLTIIAAIITLTMGICLSFGKRWRVVNLFPALLIPPIYTWVVEWATKLVDK